jgi:hypothetical protein
MYQLESLYWLTSMIKGLIAKIKHALLLNQGIAGPTNNMGNINHPL